MVPCFRNKIKQKKYQLLLSGWVDSCSCACLCQARLLTEGDLSVIGVASSPSPAKAPCQASSECPEESSEIVDKNQGGQRIKSKEETVVFMEFENAFFFPWLHDNKFSKLFF